jgi:NAD(P)-dependent dehydrogenase (short-subunit alcohol dehydrogenase family)
MKDKVVLITGAARGIGAGIARCFIEQGARVVITDLDERLINSAADELGENAIGLVADAASQEVMSKTVDQVIDQFSGLDVLVNNAGIGGPKIEFDEISSSESAFMGMSDDVWDQQLMFNLRTTFSSSHAAIPRLSDGGSIVNIASIAALGPTAQLPAYGAAKAGVVHLTKTLAIELAPRRIRVNCICPGLLWTRAWELLTTQMKANQPELANMTNRQIFESVVEGTTPLGGEQTPEDIGNLAVFYASDKARMITGQVVAVDGGISVK